MREVNMGDGKILHMPDTMQRKPVEDDGGYQCECHRKMGNDFWFLPTGSCLRKDNTCEGSR
jgi:hypothetical protein